MTSCKYYVFNGHTIWLISYDEFKQQLLPAFEENAYLPKTWNDRYTIVKIYGL